MLNLCEMYCKTVEDTFLMKTLTSNSMNKLHQFVISQIFNNLKVFMSSNSSNSKKAPREQNRGFNCRRHQGTMLKGMLMIKIIYMCVTRNSCTPTCTPRAQCRRASCLGLGIINRERVFSDYSIIGSLTAEGTKGRCKMVYLACDRFIFLLVINLPSLNMYLI